MIPKVELHVHLEGTARPKLIAQLAQRHQISLPADLIADSERFPVTDFPTFLDVYDTVASVIKTAEDYRDVTYEYLTASAAEGCLYTELIASPQHAEMVGLPYDDLIAGIAQGIDDARSKTGIEARVIVNCIRHFGVEAATRTAAMVVNRPQEYVTGFGISGDEANYCALQFKRAFEIADEAGLGITVHAGEWAGPESIRAALKLCGVTRIGHGVRSIEDQQLVIELVRRKIVLECCPLSNLTFGVYDKVEDHPLQLLRDAGVAITLASDDPPYVGSSIGREYQFAQTEFGLSKQDLLEITLAAIDAAFIPEVLKTQLLAKTAATGNQIEHATG